MSESGRELRNALGTFATGVTIITTVTGDGERIGMTVNSFSSVSLDPPLILFSVSRNAYSLGSLLETGRYMINVLSEEDREVSTRFAKALSEKWAEVDFRRGPGNLPVLESALSRFECELHVHHEAGDHVVLICRVIDFEVHRTARPLLFFQGKYHELHRPVPTPPWFADAIHGWGA